MERGATVGTWERGAIGTWEGGTRNMVGRDKEHGREGLGTSEIRTGIWERGIGTYERGTMNMGDRG